VHPVYTQIFVYAKQQCSNYRYQNEARIHVSAKRIKILCTCSNSSNIREVSSSNLELLEQLLTLRLLTQISCVTCEHHARWVPCHHNMADPQVADVGDALQLWRATANILNKQSRTADKGWSSSLGGGRGANNSSP
jgi:hypothetical protein